jgi:hypothetical protein
VLGWQAAYAPTEIQKQECQSATKGAGQKTDECKSLWEKTTTDPVAFFTFVLAVSTISLWATSIWSGRRQSADMKQMADIAEKQLAISAAQTDIQEKQHAIGRLQFLATHRPKIRTKHVVLKSNILAATKVLADVTLINDGTAEAFIVEFGVKFFIQRKGDMLPPISKFQPAKTVIDRFPLGLGVSTTFEGVTDGTTLSELQTYAIPKGDLALYCVGYVHYVDGVGQIRTTAFCRKLIFAENASSWVDTGRFRIFDDPDYEYAS